MEYTICEWDSDLGIQVNRPATADEIAEIKARAAAAPGPNVPTSVTRKAARLALLNARKLQLVQQAISALPEPQRTRTQIEWDDSQTYERSNPTVIMIGNAIGLDSYGLDDIFIKAAALQ